MGDDARSTDATEQRSICLFDLLLGAGLVGLDVDVGHPLLADHARAVHHGDDVESVASLLLQSRKQITSAKKKK